MKSPKEYTEELVGKHFVIMTNDLSFDTKRAITHAKIDVQNTIDALEKISKYKIGYMDTEITGRDFVFEEQEYFKQVLTELENL